MKLSALIASVPNATVRGNAEIDIHEVVFDSRLATPASLFVALRGGYADGHMFLRAARAAGAVAAVVERDAAAIHSAEYAAVVEVDDSRAALASIAAAYYSQPSAALRLIGVTGTDGKTTTSHFIDAICRTAGMTTGLIGTVEIRIGDERDVHESRQTTPESLLVQGYLATMRDRGIDVAIVEATSHGLELHRVDGCLFDIGVITNITREHLDFHGTIANYRAAKGGLLRRVAEARHAGKLGISVVNADDEGAMAVLPSASGSDVVLYSAAGDSVAAVTASEIEADGAGSQFRLATPAGSTDVRIHLPGRYNVANALAAAAAGLALGFRLDVIAAGLASLKSVSGRMETVEMGQPFAVIVDYAHTPEAIRSVLAEARRLASGKVMVLFGSAGERDVEKRAIQGAVAVTNADFAVFTSEDPRFEDADGIIEQIAAGAEEAGGRRGVDFDCIEDRRAAIADLLSRAAPGDVLVLAGKGHEQSMIYGAEKRPWNESAVARELLQELGYTARSTS